MKVTLKQAFSLLDGRLSTEMGDVYLMLNYIFDENLMTHQLPTAIRKLKEVNPEWFQKGVGLINDLKESYKTDDFGELIHLIEKIYPDADFELGKVNAKFKFFDGLV